VNQSQHDERAVFEDMFSHYRPEEIPRLYIYCYHHLDDLSFVRKPSEVFRELGPSDLKSLVDAVKSRFLSAGWEGDGNVGLIWLPPFVDTGIEDTWGTYLWHVKQENNGTSWLGSKHPLNFGRIREQNEKRGNGTFVSIVYHAGKALVDDAKSIVDKVARKTTALANLADPVAADIRTDLLMSAQGELVSELQTFLDECYFEVLMQVLNEGNPSRLRLGKFKANLNLSYLPADDGAGEIRDRANVAQWFTLKGLIGDIWRSFKFEPFASKTQMIFNACEYKIADDIRLQVTKHVQLRNCIQHHSRVITEDALRIAGVKEFVMLTDTGHSVRLAADGPILFSLAELKEFCESLVKLATDFDQHMGDRVKPVWVSERPSAIPEVQE
jgi:hypothetical protein